MESGSSKAKPSDPAPKRVEAEKVPAPPVKAEHCLVMDVVAVRLLACENSGPAFSGDGKTRDQRSSSSRVSEVVQPCAPRPNERDADGDGFLPVMS